MGVLLSIKIFVHKRRRNEGKNKKREVFKSLSACRKLKLLLYFSNETSKGWTFQKINVKNLNFLKMSYIFKPKSPQNWRILYQKFLYSGLKIQTTKIRYKICCVECKISKFPKIFVLQKNQN